MKTVGILVLIFIAVPFLIYVYTMTGTLGVMRGRKRHEEACNEIDKRRTTDGEEKEGW